ncbi:YitT family protein [Calidifontibacillus oryziterrae]|uniref:YitT family protein n=1 Tax=Calidifontibacillus oryziterrae TaxID=1191699 RepID=UPI0002D34F68|nr:YitT family protein [Calidifontibacillus oryziterrae]
MNKPIITYILIFIGAILQGLAMSLFLFPHDIPSGGAAGLAILVNYLIGIPLGLGLWIVNFIFLTVALKFFGYSWTIKTMFAVTTTSVTVSLLTTYLKLPHIHFFLDLLFGSIIFGTGVGLLIRNGASSGGMVIPALMISNYFRYRPGQVMFFINLSIFLLTSIVINWKIVIFAIVCQFISTTIIDFVNEFELPSVSSPSFGWRKK